MKKKKKSKEGLILVSTYTKPLVPTYLFDGIEIKITIGYSMYLVSKCVLECSA